MRSRPTTKTVAEKGRRCPRRSGGGQSGRKAWAQNFTELGHNFARGDFCGPWACFPSNQQCQTAARLCTLVRFLSRPATAGRGGPSAACKASEGWWEGRPLHHARCARHSRRFASASFYNRRRPNAAYAPSPVSRGRMSNLVLAMRSHPSSANKQRERSGAVEALSCTKRLFSTRPRQ